MFESLVTAFSSGPAVNPTSVFVRLIAALAAGFCVAWIYRRTTRHTDFGSFPTTLILLCVLIAMVTQVIGNNVARAFSLVGALSIVRFRTVVRDTRDTAFVVFSVVVGMAIGSQDMWVAVLGIVITGGASFLIARREHGSAGGERQPPLLLTLRIGFGHDPEKLLGATLNAYLSERNLMSVSTAKQGASLQVVYEARMRPGGSAVELVGAMNQTEGVQDVRLSRRGFEAE
jgi:hypothetical protein